MPSNPDPDSQHTHRAQAAHIEACVAPFARSFACESVCLSLCAENLLRQPLLLLESC